MHLDFNCPLSPAALNGPNWTIRHGGFRYTGALLLSASPAPHQVTGSFIKGAPDPGVTSVDYAPPPADLLSATLVPAAAFAAFPLVAVP